MSSTQRLYSAAQRAFLGWCIAHGLQWPAVDNVSVARYLRKCERERGPSAVPVHLSAIARLYRRNGLNLDTKADVIQAIVSRCRTAMRS